MDQHICVDVSTTYIPHITATLDKQHAINASGAGKKKMRLGRGLLKISENDVY